MKKLLLASVLSLNVSLTFAMGSPAYLLIEHRKMAVQSTCTYITNVTDGRQYIKVERFLKRCESRLTYLPTNGSEGIVHTVNGKYVGHVKVFNTYTRIG